MALCELSFGELGVGMHYSVKDVFYELSLGEVSLDILPFCEMEFGELFSTFFRN